MKDKKSCLKWFNQGIIGRVFKVQIGGMKKNGFLYNNPKREC